MIELVLKVSGHGCSDFKESVTKCMPSLVSILADEGIVVDSLQSIEKTSPFAREIDNHFYIMGAEEVNKDFNLFMKTNNYNYVIIRIPVDGYESWDRKIALAEEIMLKSGNTLESNYRNVYFFFDTGNFSDFRQVIGVIFSQNGCDDYIRNYCRKYNLSYISWLSKSNRDFIRKVEKGNGIG